MNATIGYALCGSFCTFSRAIAQIRTLLDAGLRVVPVMSEAAYSTDTRFGAAADFRAQIEAMCGREIVHTIVQAEPFGPGRLVDAVVVSPCTGNTLGKLAAGITDTPVTMAVKSTLRNGRPILLAVSTNDALACSAANIGRLMNTRGIYFVPMRQDDWAGKPASLVADFDRVLPALEAALAGRQLQPLLL